MYYHEIVLLSPMIILLVNNFAITHDIIVNAVIVIIFAVYKIDKVITCLFVTSALVILALLA